MYTAQIKENTVASVIVGNKQWAMSRLGGYWVDTEVLVAIGDTYDPIADVFISPQPYPSWTLDGNFDWQPPTPMPDDGTQYVWDEANLVWQAPPVHETEATTDE